ncbi:restriction endonuclease [Kitasatospora sp. NPDC059795]|uniref:restriction endonuclease n=1 Tax=Kitasatospora sp. NPDC059795 TaxID=3346949 RepID=UPI00365C7AA4
MGNSQDWDQCLYCGRPVRLTGSSADGSQHRLAGGWTGTVHNVAARCTWGFVRVEEQLIPTRNLRRGELVFRPDASWRTVRAVGVLGPLSLRELHSASDSDYAVVTEANDATLCRADDLWLQARPATPRAFLPLTIRSFADVRSLHHTQFEHLIADLLHLSGCSIVQENGKANDRGADVIAVTAAGRRLVVQCKHWTSKVSFSEVTKVGGTARQLHGADDVLVVALTGFTEPAWDYAEKAAITLLDGPDLKGWLQGKVPASLASWD